MENLNTLVVCFGDNDYARTMRTVGEILFELEEYIRSKPLSEIEPIVQKTIRYVLDIQGIPEMYDHLVCENSPWGAFSGFSYKVLLNDDAINFVEKMAASGNYEALIVDYRECCVDIF